jgi:hypothetical protein
MRIIVMAGLAGLLVFGLMSSAQAGRRGGGGHGSHAGSHASRDRSGSSGSGASSGSHVVRGYTTKRGTYVAPHHATNPDHTQRNNYSTKGNVNPWTGKAGTKAATH